MTPAEEVRQRCGTVYTWNCAGELYGIECELCEERPLCALDEFAEHMEIWHSDWQQAPEDELMLEVLAEQSSGGEVNELKQQLVQELNALDAQPPTTLPTSQQQTHEQTHEQLELPEQPPLLDTLCLTDHVKFDADVSTTPGTAYTCTPPLLSYAQLETNQSNKLSKKVRQQLKIE